MSQQKTKNRILDTAEKLLALQGFSETSLRQITAEAGVNLAAVNYHFRSKDGLLDAVLARRIAPLNRSRLSLLADVENGAHPPTVHEIISCFIRPTLDMLGSGCQKRYFVLLLGRVLSETSGPQIELLHCHMQPVFAPFFDAFRRIRPHLETSVIFWGMHFSIGVMAHNIRLFCNMQIALPEPITSDFSNYIPVQENMVIDIELLGDMIINFVTSGLEATYA